MQAQDHLDKLSPGQLIEPSSFKDDDKGDKSQSRLLRNNFRKILRILSAMSGSAEKSEEGIPWTIESGRLVQGEPANAIIASASISISTWGGIKCLMNCNEQSWRLRWQWRFFHFSSNARLPCGRLCAFEPKVISWVPALKTLLRYFIESWGNLLNDNLKQWVTKNLWFENKILRNLLFMSCWLNKGFQEHLWNLICQYLCLRLRQFLRKI